MEERHSMKLSARVCLTKLCMKLNRSVRATLLQYTKLPMVMIDEIILLCGTYYTGDEIGDIIKDTDNRITNSFRIYRQLQDEYPQVSDEYSLMIDTSF